jgi:hypothetical protein
MAKKPAAEGRDMMNREEIKAGGTYRTAGGSLWRVLAREGEKLTIRRIDEAETHECSVGRFAARAISLQQDTRSAT